MIGEVADFKIVRNSTVGTELSEDKAKLLAEKMGVRHLDDGEVLVKEGAADQTLFILGQRPLLNRFLDCCD